MPEGFSFMPEEPVSEPTETPVVDVVAPDPEPVAAQPIAMSEESAEAPLSAPLGSVSARPLLFAVSQEWIPFLPIPGTYSHTMFGTLDLTSEKYARIVDNFKANAYGQTLPINAEHDSIASGAVGWIRDMRIASDGSIEVKPEWNDRGRALIDGDRFRYVSAEFCNRWQDPVSGIWHDDVAVGLAICTRPHFKTDVLKPLAASEAFAMAQSTVTAGDAGKESQMADEPKVETPVIADPPKVDAPLPPISINDLTQVVLTAEQRQRERQMFTDLMTRVELAERRATTAEAELKRIATERRVEKFTAEVMGRSPENGQPWFGPIKDNVDHLVSLAESHGDDSAEVRWAVTQKRNEARAIQASGLFDPISIAVGEEISSVETQINRLAEQYRMADQSLTKEKAISKAYNENPELYTRTLKR